jgi:phosphate transport system permease protein
LEWGNAYGIIKEIRLKDEVLATGRPEVEKVLPELISKSQALRSQILALQRGELGRINKQKEALRLEIEPLRVNGSPIPAELEEERNALEVDYAKVETEVSLLKSEVSPILVLQIANGTERLVKLSSVTRVYFPNSLSLGGKFGIYFSKIWEFVSEDPRESNTEGGIFPAIYGTVLMVMLMSVVVTPLGVLTAIYLREYAKQGRFVTFVRIAVNNLAGVPSIVFGVFGVGFFIYFVGAHIDQAFYSDQLPTPTFGTGGILWASLTLALLTLPIVIVTAEEGLSSIPNHLREGSYALGATKFETLWRVILPSLTPSILTGVILAVARAAGEVAPLMITGVVKLAASLPLDAEAPFLHLDRKFMHLGFHIYDVGFQSPNVDAARPMVYSTTLLLILIVVVLNLTAVVLRNKLRRRFASSAV